MGVIPKQRPEWHSGLAEVKALLLHIRLGVLDKRVRTPSLPAKSSLYGNYKRKPFNAHLQGERQARTSPREKPQPLAGVP